MAEPGADLRNIGKYEVMGILGKGAMGVVYKARDPEIGRYVAIKTLRQFDLQKSGGREAALERFRNEARSAGNLRHANIVTIFEVNCHGNIPYIVMDYVDGASLDSMVQKYRRLAPGLALHYLNQIGGAIDYAHGRGVIHRDLKPSNIIVDRADVVYVLDFGVASMNKSYDGWESPGQGVVVGTPSYMSPEQVLNQRLDRRSDLFSLAVMAFELLSGRRPFTGTDFNEVVHSIVHNRPIALSAVAPDLPLALEAEFERALAKRREERFGSAQEMVRAFGKAIGIDIPGAISLSLSGRALGHPEPHGVQAPAPGGEPIGLGRGIDPSPVVEPSHPSPSPDSTASPTRPPNPSPWDPLTDSGPRARGIRRGDAPTPGDLFAHVTGSMTDEVRRAPIFVEAAPSPRRWMAWGFLAVAVVVGATLVWQLADEARGGGSLVPPRTFGGGVDSGAGVGIARNGGEVSGDLHEPLSEPPPPGMAVSEMSDRQLLGVLKAKDVPEIVVLSALREARARKVAGLVDASVNPLRSDSYIVRVETIKTLAEIGDKRIVPILMLGLDDHDPLVRGHTARALGHIGDRRAIAYLNARLLREDSPEVKIAIRRSIERITGVPVSP